MNRGGEISESLKMLLGNKVEEKQNTSNTKQNLQYIDLNKITPNLNQPRKTFNENELNQLAESVKKHGILQPILLKPKPAFNGFEIIAGERRWRAAKIANLAKIPAIIYEIDYKTSMAFSLIENIQRENLNVMDEAEAVGSLIQDYSITHEQVGELIGRSRTTVTNLLRLLDLHDGIKAMLKADLLDMGHARALLALNRDEQLETAKEVVTKNLSVRETEKLIGNKKNKRTAERYFDPTHIEKAKFWQEVLFQKLQSKANLTIKPDGKSQLTIHFGSFKNAEEFLTQLLEIKLEKH